MYGAALDRVRETSPLVHCITNYVSMDLAANALLAVGASPAMVHATEEVADFANLSSALVNNIGTLSPRWVDAMEEAARVTVHRDRPVVLDPVGAGATTYRSRAAARLIRAGVSIIRGNASEIRALVGSGSGGKGVDSTDPVEAALKDAKQLAGASHAVVALTGARDLVTDGKRVIEVRGGHHLMTRVTAVGCALSAVVGAFAAVESDRLTAAVAALATFKAAGSQAGSAASSGPGSFRAALLDALYSLDGRELDSGAWIVEAS